MITEYLSIGIENARTGRELAKLLDIDIRDVAKNVERERRAGAPIVASCDSKNPGYYLAETADELQTYCRRLHQRADQSHKTRRALLKTAETMPPQEPQQ